MSSVPGVCTLGCGHRGHQQPWCCRVGLGVCRGLGCLGLVLIPVLSCPPEQAPHGGFPQPEGGRSCRVHLQEVIQRFGVHPGDRPGGRLLHRQREETQGQEPPETQIERRPVRGGQGLIRGCFEALRVPGGAWSRATCSASPSCPRCPQEAAPCLGVSRAGAAPSCLLGAGERSRGAAGHGVGSSPFLWDGGFLLRLMSGRCSLVGKGQRS